MTAYPIPNPFTNFVSAAGLPLTGAKIYIGVAGDDPETNPIAVYSNAALTIPLAQPIRTNGGYIVGTGTPANAYPSVTPYSIRVRTSAGVEVFYLAEAHDEIADFFVTMAGADGSSKIGFTAAGTGAVTRTVQSKLRDIPTPPDYGIGVDGESLGIGAGALQSITSGIRNAGYGYHALAAVTNGSENAAFGYRALASVTGGVDPFGSYNAGFGSNALGSLTTGYKNAAFGRDSMDNLTTGFNDSAFGYGSMHLATTAINCVAVGFESLHGGALGPVTAQGVVAVGFRAAYENLTGDFLTAVGTSALANNTTGARSSAFGTNALNGNIVGNDTSAFGYFAGLTSTGSGNIFFGSGADADAGLSNVGVIGVGVHATLANTFYLGSDQDVIPGANARSLGTQAHPWLQGTFSDAVYAFSGTATPAGGSNGKGFLLSSTPNFGIFFGSGAPTLSAARGSKYMRTDGSTTNNREYINTDGGTTWTAVITAA